MAALSYRGIDQVGNRFNVQFHHDNFGGVRTMVRVDIFPECDDGFWPWSDCSIDEDGVEDARQVTGYIDENATPDYYYRFKIKRTKTKEVGDCVILTYEWKMWAGIYPVVDGGGVINTPIGEVTAHGGFLPDQSGEFLIKICCDDDCNPIITLMGGPSDTSGGTHGEEEDG